MSKYIPDNQKLLTLENRIYIENELNKGTSFNPSTPSWGKGQTIAGWVTPLSLTLDTIARIASSSRTWNGWFLKA